MNADRKRFLVALLSILAVTMMGASSTRLRGACRILMET